MSTESSASSASRINASRLPGLLSQNGSSKPTTARTMSNPSSCVSITAPLWIGVHHSAPLPLAVTHNCPSYRRFVNHPSLRGISFSGLHLHYSRRGRAPHGYGTLPNCNRLQRNCHRPFIFLRYYSGRRAAVQGLVFQGLAFWRVPQDVVRSRSRLCRPRRRPRKIDRPSGGRRKRACCQRVQLMESPATRDVDRVACARIGAL